jgi:homoserine kinase
MPLLLLRLWLGPTLTPLPPPPLPLRPTPHRLVCAQTFRVNVVGEGSASLARDDSNLVVQAAKLAFEAAGVPMPPITFTCTNAIPFGAGLGSSSAAIVSGILGGAALAGASLSKDQVLQLATVLEHHVDNLAPCVHGNLQVR